MDDDNDRTIVRSGHLPRLQVPENNPGPPLGMNALPVGTRLGEFEILSLIGEGGFGIVYLGYDHSLDRQIALKEYMPSALASRTKALLVTVRSRNHADTFKMGLKSFVNEARLLARFDSPSLVKVYRFWEENGTAYMVMPFYQGVTLKQALNERLIVPDEQWMRSMLTNLLDAIATIHSVQCFHRDIAPDNILLLKDGRPLLLDFGAARRVIGDLTQGLTVILKPGFAPIEQYADIPGLRQGAWTDIYALGAVIYYLITSKPPPPSVARIVNDDMLPAREAGKGRYSASFLATLDKMLAVKPEQRIQSVAELRQALGLDETVPHTMPQAVAPAAMHGRGTSPEPPVPPGSRIAPEANDNDWLKTMVADQRPMPPPKTSSKAGLVAAGVLLSAGIGVAVVGYRWMHPAPPSASADSSSIAAADGSSGGSGSTGNGASGSDAATPNQSGTANIATAPPPVMGPPPAPAVPSAGAAPAAASVQKDSSKPATEEQAAPTSIARQPAIPAPVPALSAEEELWKVATSQGTPAAYEIYLKQYPRGKHAVSAKLKFDSAQAKIAAATPAKTPVLPTPPVPPTSTLSQPAPAKATPSGTEGRSASKTAEPAVAAPATAASAPATAVLPPQPAEPARSPSATVVATPSAPTAPAPTAAAVSSGGPATPGTSDSGSTSSPAVAMNTPTPERPKVELPKAEPPNKGPAKTEATPAPVPPPPATTGQKTLKLAGQTMIGTFAPDPVTGVMTGSGQINWDNGDHFTGKLVNGIKVGKGQFTWANGQRYSGDWSGDMPNGKGVLQFANGNRYEGEVKNGEPNGRGTIRFRSGDIYTGSWVNGKHHGHGRYTWTDGTYWEGEFKNGSQTENGKTVFAANGSKATTSPSPPANATGGSGEKPVAETSGK